MAHLGRALRSGRRLSDAVTPWTYSQFRWREYGLEALELACFMVSALVVTTLVEHPASPIRQMLPDPLRRRALIGVAMGLTAASIIYSPWGRQSGAHFNPSVTLTFLRLGKITPRDALFYVMRPVRRRRSRSRRCVGGLLRPDRQRSRGELRGHRARPSRARWSRFSAELTISFGMMTMILLVSNSAPVCVDDRRDGRVHGRGLHHVRSASLGHEHEPRAQLRSRHRRPARPGRSWVYFLAPPLGMLLAAELYVRTFGRGASGAPSCTILDRHCHFGCERNASA